MRKIITAFMMMLCAACVASAANYLTFTAEEDGSTFGIVNVGNTPDVQYSLDGGETWTALAAGDTITLAHKGEKALLRGDNPEGFSKSRDQYSTFRMTGKVSASGSVMSLIDGTGLSTEIPNGYCFCRSFRSCTSLTRAPELPATTLTAFCYDAMFLGCTSLTEAPELPATTLANFCYDGMFDGCTSLTQAPELPAMTLVEDCYDGMFAGCTSLTQAPELPATTLAGDCYNSMFSGCTGLTQAPELPATKLADFCYKFMFRGCTSLTQAPELPATTLAVACYAGMFEGCTSLTQAPKLSATTLAESCCHRMFSGCTSLTQAPELPATTLAEACYDGMFEGCTSLTQAPELPATTLAEDCYSWMFRGCTSLTEAPELPAMTLEGFCYNKMFSDCTSLTQAPELPATTLFDGCYWEMFSGCTSLTQAPELPATTLTERCYMSMFSGCTRLSEIHVSFDDWHDDYSTAAWVKNVAPTGTFICPKALALEYGEDRIPEGWTVKYIDDTVAAETNYLTFTAEEDGSTFGIVNNGGNNPDIQYSLDGGETWIALAAGDTITLAHKGDKALLKGNNPEGFSKSRDQYSTFRMTGKVSASGSVMSLIDGVGISTEVPGNYCFVELFKDCTSLTQAPELPATTLVYACYASMFRGCTSLTEAPELPATTLAGDCYASMFRGCTSLTEAPELPATTLAGGCYYYMFEGCTSLIRAPQISALTMDFRDCIAAMFSGCTNLSEISVAFEEWSNIVYTQEWVANVAPTGTFICPKALALEYGEDRIPEGWTVQYVEDLNYLTFTAEEDGSTFGIVNGRNSPNVLYSLDGGKTWTFLAEGDTVRLAHKGDKALLKGNNPQGFSRNRMEYQSSFKMTGKIAASGSVMSLIDGTGLSSEIRGVECFGRLFENCTSLTQAPELPATTLTEDCYYGMFRGCTGLTQAPELPATTLADWCYRAMFEGCTGLIQAPELPATTLVSGCYSEMFRGCTGLTQAPALPATTLAEYCYYEMFRGCTSLSKAPALPATTLAEYCYSDMFSSCTSLTEAPELPATTLANNCYAWMFSGCTSLTKAPNLPATELPAPVNKNFCYGSMFLNCTNLSEISVAFTEWDANTARWVADVAPTGTFICPKALALEYGEDRIPEGWTVKYIDDTVAVDDTVVVEANYLTFTAEEDNSTFGIKNTNNEPDVQYSLDGGKTWTALADGDSIVLAKKGDKALLKGNNPKGFSHDYLNCTQFVMSGSISASGSVMSLIDGVGLSVTIPCDYCFHSMFSGCTSLAQAPELPATALAGNCYWSMFSGCTSLVQAPELPATTLAGHCYAYMFKECTSLTQAPELPATTLALRCYEQMFSGCTSLTQVSALPATTLDSYCYVYMFSGCTSLTKAPELPATTLDSCCYAYMFSGCTSLTQTPELPATTLADRCYYSMFKGCTGLMRASELPATTLASGCYSTMFSDCTNLTQYPELPATTLADRCYHSMFSGCTGLTEALALPATTLANNCYYSMFSGCTSLTKAPKLPATDLPIPSGKSSCCGSMFSGCTNLSEISVAFNEWNDNTFEWVKDVAPAGTFICPEDLPVRYGMSRIPRGWAAKNIIDGDTVDVPINYNYLTFTAEEDGSTFGIDCYLLEADVQYSLDGGNTWTKLALGDTVVLAQKGDKALIRGYNEYRLGENTKDYVHFVMTGAIAASGSVMSLIDEIGLSKEIPRTSYFFQRLFINCTSLTQAPELPATTLSDACYCGMFSGCTGLTQAPELPATALASYCYWYMFSGCTGLTKAPELPATTTSVWCYDEMFSGCTNMSEIKVSFDDWSSQYPTIDWVKDVAPTGTFICPKALPLEYGVSRIPEGWTVQYIGEEGSGVSSALADGITVWTDGLTVYVRGAEGEVSLYDLSGKRVAVSVSADEERALSVPSKGVYMVRTNNGTSVVLVR